MSAVRYTETYRGRPIVPKRGVSVTASNDSHLPFHSTSSIVTSRPVIACLVAVFATYAVGIAVFPWLRRKGRPSAIAQWFVTAACAAALFLIPSEQVVLRALTAFPLTDLMLRVTDFGRQSRAGRTTNCTWGWYSRFLVPVPLLLVVFGQKDRRLADHTAWKADLSRFAGGALVLGVGTVCLLLAQHSSLLRSSFWLDHAVKLVVWVVALEAAARGLSGLERLFGYDTSSPIDNAYRSRTPAEFWVRWNHRVHGWLYCNTFLPAGGHRSPARGVAAAFLVSAVLHEVMFAIATSRVTGYQALFFLVQIPAVLASRPLARLARGRPGGMILGHVLTIAWMSLTSVFFFHGIDLIFPFFYAAEPPLP